MSQERVSEIERQLWIARDAALGAEATKGALAAEMTTIRADLEASQAHQQMWDSLIAQLEGIDGDQLGRSLNELDRVRHRLHEVERRVDAASLAEKLTADGFAVQAFSGELAQAQRTRTINAFRSGTIKTLVSTDVA